MARHFGPAGLLAAAVALASTTFADEARVAPADPGADASQGSQGQGTQGWTRTRDENGIEVYRKQVPGSSFLAFRGEGDIDKPLLLVGSVLVDINRDREWMDSLVESKVLRTVSETEYITYSHVGTPITMSDRDFVTDVTLATSTPSKTLAIRMHSVDDPSAPKTKYVRGALESSSFVLTSIDGGRRTHVVAEIHCDPKGSIAAWIVNKFQNDWGFNTIKRLRAQVTKPDIAVHPHLKEVLEKNGFFD